jgi:hypothetical protein
MRVMVGDASCSPVKQSVGVARDDNDEKTTPCVELNTHGGMRKGVGGKDRRWMGTPDEIDAPVTKLVRGTDGVDAPL